jgi:hypothetical protein
MAYAISATFKVDIVTYVRLNIGQFNNTVDRDNFFKMLGNLIDYIEDEFDLVEAA